jgi:hypothetical protein
LAFSQGVLASLKDRVTAFGYRFPKVKTNVKAESLMLSFRRKGISFFKLRLQELLVWTKMEVRPLRFL